MVPVRVLTGVLGLVFLASGGMKLLGITYSLRNREKFGIPLPLWRTVGALELAGVTGLLVGLVVAPLGVAAAVGLALVMVGAVVTRLRVHDPVVMVLADVVVLALTVAYVVVRV